MLFFFVFTCFCFHSLACFVFNKPLRLWFTLFLSSRVGQVQGGGALILPSPDFPASPGEQKWSQDENQQRPLKQAVAVDTALTNISYNTERTLCYSQIHCLTGHRYSTIQSLLTTVANRLLQTEISLSAHEGGVSPNVYAMQTLTMATLLSEYN